MVCNILVSRGLCNGIWKVWWSLLLMDDLVIPEVKNSVRRAFSSRKLLRFYGRWFILSLPRVFLALKAEGVPGWWTAAWRNPLFPNGHSAQQHCTACTAKFVRQRQSTHIPKAELSCITFVSLQALEHCRLYAPICTYICRGKQCSTIRSGSGGHAAAWSHNRPLLVMHPQPTQLCSTPIKQKLLCISGIHNCGHLGIEVAEKCESVSRWSFISRLCCSNWKVSLSFSSIVLPFVTRYKSYNTEANQAKPYYTPRHMIV